MDTQKLGKAIEEVITRNVVKHNLMGDITGTISNISKLIESGKYGPIVLYNLSGRLHDIEDNLLIISKAEKAERNDDYDNPDYPHFLNP